jgi:hypothetical protein
MNHGILDVFAYQEALLIEAVFAVVLLTMVWVGFRRWLQHKERIGSLIAEQAAQQIADMARVEERLDAIEKLVTAGRTAEIEAPAKRDGDLADL